MALPEHLQHLLSPDAYPHPVSTVEVVETHVSWVLLTGSFAYKIKRPVRYDFVDMRFVESRMWLCEEEMRLNQRFSPRLYLGVAMIRRDAGRATLRGEGEPIEPCVRMVQFDRGNELDRLLDAGRMAGGTLRGFGAGLSGIHDRLPVADPGTGFGAPERVPALIGENLRQCAEASRHFGMQDAVGGLATPLASRAEALLPLMQDRFRAGFVRECHGDLHAANIVWHEGGLVPFDCMEFQPAFRWIDVAQEIAFLCADLEARGFRSAAHEFLAGYLDAGGDFQSLGLLDLFQAHQALVRAKVVALSAAACGLPERQSALERFGSYLSAARRALEPRRPRLILMQGPSGSGKSWLAARIAAATGGIHLRSDLERNRGIARGSHGATAPGEGRYAPSAVSEVYARLVRAAREVLGAGRLAIVDATFGRRADRTRFQALAVECGAPLRVIRCTAAEAVLKERIRARLEGGSDPSEADLQVLEWQQRHHEPIDPDEGLEVIDVQTAVPMQPSLNDLLARLERAPEGGPSHTAMQ